MEKLIELLNEFRPTVSCANFKEHYEFIDDDIYLIREGMDGEEEQFPMYVCYKKGDFVKWLVENDKIDLDMVREKLGIPCCVWYGSGKIIAVNDVEDYGQVLMLLSISDTPIEDLILYLN